MSLPAFTGAWISAHIEDAVSLLSVVGDSLLPFIIKLANFYKQYPDVASALFTIALIYILKTINIT